MNHSEGIREFNDWLRDYRPERPDHQQQVRVSAQAVETLERALRRRPALGAFGQSQAGKSYLINALLRDEQNHFFIKGHPDGEQLNFIDCNPNKNAEATALITRFTTAADADWDIGFFKIDLLSLEEMIGSLFHGFVLQVNADTRIKLNDGNPFSISNYEADGEGSGPFLGKEALRQMDNLLNDKSILQYSYLKSRAIEVRQFLAGKSRIGSALASSLISSVLWPGYNQLSELASRLIVAYADLGEVRALFAPFALENVKAVLDTEHLLGRAAQHYRCSISRRDANRVYLDIGETGERNLRDIQALAKEITFFVRPDNKIAPCISELDLLDFPGLRPFHDAETQVGEDNLDRSDLPWWFMKMGKLPMFIKSSTKYDEIPLLLYCTEFGPQNAPQVAMRIKQWLEQNEHDQERLITVMTKSDNLWHGHVTPDVIKDRLKTRFETHFKSELGETIDYERYEQAYLVRNPLVSSGLTDQDTALQEEFLSSPHVQQYIGSRREATWDALIDKDDGGFSILAQELNRLCVGIAQKREQKLESKLRELMVAHEIQVRSFMIKEDELEHSREVSAAAKKLITDIRELGEIELLPSILRWVGDSFPGVEYAFQPINGSTERTNTATERVNALVEDFLKRADQEMTARQSEWALSGKALPSDSADWYKRALIQYLQNSAGLSDYINRYINVFGQLEEKEREALWEAIRSIYAVTATYLGKAPTSTLPDPSESLGGFFAEKSLFHHWEANVDSFFAVITPQMDLTGQEELKVYYDNIHQAIKELA